jgi:hypothetical protein
MSDETRDSTVEAIKLEIVGAPLHMGDMTLDPEPYPAKLITQRRKEGEALETWDRYYRRHRVIRDEALYEAQVNKHTPKFFAPDSFDYQQYPTTDYERLPDDVTLIVSGVKRDKVGHTVRAGFGSIGERFDFDSEALEGLQTSELPTSVQIFLDENPGMRAMPRYTTKEGKIRYVTWKPFNPRRTDQKGGVPSIAIMKNEFSGFKPDPYVLHDEMEYTIPNSASEAGKLQAFIAPSIMPQILTHDDHPPIIGTALPEISQVASDIVRAQGPFKR